MKVLLCGDVSGRSGREVLKQNLERYRNSVDFIMVNVDNAAHGFGITPTMVREILSWGADALTGGKNE